MSKKLNEFVRSEIFKIIEKADTAKQKIQLKKAIKSEIRSILSESEQKAPNISKKLEELRSKLIEQGNIKEYGSANVSRMARPECRIPLETVSRIIQVPVNELILHFLNGHRIQEGISLVEYRLGCVYFYGNPVKEELKEGATKFGSGTAFKNLTKKLSHQKGVKNPKALAASIGRKKYGKEKFQAAAAKGKKK